MANTDVATESVRRITGHPLARPSFALIWAGLFVSVTGDAFYRVALTLSVAHRGAFGLAGLGIALALPTAMVGLFAGVIIDRSNVVRLLIRTDLARCAVVALLGILLFQRHPSLFGTFALAALLAFISVVFTPALQAILPELAKGDRDTLIAMDAWILGALSVVGVIGPAAAGALLQYVNGAVLLLIDAATFAFSALMIFLAGPPAPERKPDTPGARISSRLSGVSQGLRFLMSHPVLRPCFQVFPFMDFAFSALPFVLPLLPGTGHGSAPVRYGSQIAALAIGRVCGMAVLNKSRLKEHRGLVLRLNFLGQGAGILLFAATGGAWLGLVPLVLTGIPGGAAQIAMSSYVQLEVEPQMRGRVFTALISMVTWLAPFGPIVFVLLAGVFSPRAAFVGIAAVLLAGGTRLLMCRPLAAVK